MWLDLTTEFSALPNNELKICVYFATVELGVFDSVLEFYDY